MISGTGVELNLLEKKLAITHVPSSPPLAFPPLLPPPLHLFVSLSLPQSTLNIRFMDYGNTESVPVTSMMALKSDFRQLPFQV